jgi:hypothetical protein
LAAAVAPGVMVVLDVGADVVGAREENYTKNNNTILARFFYY